MSPFIVIFSCKVISPCSKFTLCEKIVEPIAYETNPNSQLFTWFEFEPLELIIN